MRIALLVPIACLLLLPSTPLAVASPGPVSPNTTAAVPTSDDPTSAVVAVLDDFHDAASKADMARYFGHFTTDAVFLGTDATERWTVAEFRGYVQPHFAAGRGWTYVAVERHVMFSPDGGTAWFDEKLDNAKYGETRGTGVLRREGSAWKIAHYSLTILVPNDQAAAVVEIIRTAEASQ